MDLAEALLFVVLPAALGSVAAVGTGFAWARRRRVRWAAPALVAVVAGSIAVGASRRGHGVEAASAVMGLFAAWAILLTVGAIGVGLGYLAGRIPRWSIPAAAAFSFAMLTPAAIAAMVAWVVVGWSTRCPARTECTVF